MSKTVLFQIVQFIINTPFRLIWAIDMILSGATSPGSYWPGSDGIEGVFRLSQSSSIAGASSSDFLESYPEKQLVYSTAPPD